MNRERAKELLPVIEAFAEGKDIQFRLADDDDNFREGWLELPEDENLRITFPAPDYEYRIKPEPREVWLYDVDAGQKLADVWLNAGPSERDIDRNDLVLFREVMDE